MTSLKEGKKNSTNSKNKRKVKKSIANIFVKSLAKKGNICKRF